jgi:uncharacterized protein (TIGR03067 family)
MQRLIPAAAFLFLALPVAAADEEAAKKLNGVYEVVDVIAGGKSDESKKDAKINFVFKDGTITIRAGETKEEEAKFTVDPTQKPPHINIMPDQGGKTVQGIYELVDAEGQGTLLTIAFARAGEGGERPKDFKGTGKGEVVLKLKRKPMK